MSRIVVPLEERPAFKNGVYPHSSFKARHRVQALSWRDIGGGVLLGLLTLIGIGLCLVVLFGVIWVAYWLGEAVLRRFA